MKYPYYDIKIGDADGTLPYAYFGLSGDTDVKSGQSFPGWREAIKQGIDCTTLYTSDKRRNYTAPCYFHYHRPNSSQGHVYVYSTIINSVRTKPVFSSSLLTSAQAAFNTKLLKQRNEFGPNILAGVQVGELKETLTMLASPFKSATTLIKNYGTTAARIRSKVIKVDPSFMGNVHPHMRRVKYISRSKERASAIHAINDSYLELTYGLNPLLGDIGGIINELTSKRLRHYANVVTTVKRDAVFSQPDSSQGLSYLSLQFNNQWKESVSIKQFERLLLDAPTNSQQFGYNLASFAPSLWELLPWSFVLDYLTNIGDIISSLSQPPFEHVYGYQSTVQRQEGTCYLAAKSGPLPQFTWWDTVIVPEHKWEHTKLTRTKASGPQLKLMFEVPNLKQGLNMLSLLLSAVRS